MATKKNDNIVRDGNSYKITLTISKNNKNANEKILFNNLEMAESSGLTVALVKTCLLKYSSDALDDRTGFFCNNKNYKS